MSRLEDLRQIADETLGGLDASAGLKARILSQSQAGRKPIRKLTPVISTVCACALVVTGSLLVLNQTNHKEQSPMLMSESAQEESLEAALYEEPIAVFADAESSTENSARSFAAKSNSSLISTMAAGEAVDHLCEAALLAVKPYTVSITSDTPGYQTLWESDSSGSFPMVRVDGRYYRMLTSPAPATVSLGKAVGSVDFFTDEPALAGNDGIMSNIIPAGTVVHGVSGMEKTLVIAELNGESRVFQRISFSGHSLKGPEVLSDTIQLANHISEMSLSGVGTITGPAECSRLFSILTTQASYESSGSLSNKQCLLITLDNGITVQMIVKGDRLAACGVWSCPEFIEAFEAACQ